MRREQVIIIGAGPAGTAAAIQCRRLGVTPILLDRAGAAGGLAENAYSIENYPGLPEPLGGPEFAEKLRIHLNRFDLAVERSDVTGIMKNGEGFSVTCDCGVLDAWAVILASGTEPNRLGLAGETELDGEYLFYEVRALLRRRPNPREVIIVGGGEAACDYALTLTGAGAAVHLVVRSNRLKARGRLADAVRYSAAIRISYETRCEWIASSSPLTVRLAGAATGSVPEWSAEALLVAVGRRSAATRLLEHPRVPMSDSVAGLTAGLFVAGDARNGSLGQIGMAVGDGIFAAAAAVSYLESR